MVLVVFEEFVEISVSCILAVGFGAWAGCVVGMPFVEASVADVILVAFADFVLLLFQQFLELVNVKFVVLALWHVR